MATKKAYEKIALLYDQVTCGFAILPKGDYKVTVGSDFLRANHVPLPIHREREIMELKELLKRFDHNIYPPDVLEGLIINKVGEHHAVLYRKGEATGIVDSSSWGTSVKGRNADSRVYANKKNPMKLHDGDEISFGGWLVDYHEDSKRIEEIMRKASESKRHKVRIA